MGRIGRSFQLVGQSYRILMQDRELMVLPLMSGILTAAVVGGLAAGFGFDFSGADRGGSRYGAAFLIYVVAYAIGIFFQAAVVAGATERLRGGDPTVRSALSAATRRMGQILLWAVVAATVGVVVRVLGERLGPVGRIAAVVAGAAWSLATFFVVPVLVIEDRSVRESFGRSVGIFKKTWGESVVGSTSLGAAAICAWVTVVAITGLLATVIGLWALLVFGAGAVFLMVFFSALQGIYVASLYQYATDGRAAPGFDTAQLGEAFTAKRR
jgi:hypothetical protein